MTMLAVLTAISLKSLMIGKNMERYLFYTKKKLTVPINAYLLSLKPTFHVTILFSFIAR